MSEHPCPRCGQPTPGSFSEGGLRWAICDQCMRVDAPPAPSPQRDHDMGDFTSQVAEALVAIVRKIDTHLYGAQTAANVHSAEYAALLAPYVAAAIRAGASPHMVRGVDAKYDAYAGGLERAIATLRVQA